MASQNRPTLSPGDIECYLASDVSTDDDAELKLMLTIDGLVWMYLADDKSVSKPWCDVIACHRGGLDDSDLTETGSSTELVKCFTIHYIESKEDFLLKHEHITLYYKHDDVDSIVGEIAAKCSKDRPKRLLVLINPIGGKKQGEVLYNTVTAPIFKLAGIDTDVIVSQSPTHPEEIGNTYDFSRVDGVIIAGGDGTYAKFVNSVLPRIQRENRVSLEDPNAELKPFTVPVGVLPTGTGNGIARCHYGCPDVETATLHIVRGKKHRKHVSIIRIGGTVRWFGVYIWGHGFWSDILELDADSRSRWCRLPYLIFNAFLKSRRELRVKMEYLPYTPEGTAISATEEAEDWKTLDETVTGVYSWVHVIRPQAHSDKFVMDIDADGLTILIEKQCGRVRYFRWVYNLTQSLTAALNMDFVRTFHVKAYRLSLLDPQGTVRTEYERHLDSAMNLDGEAGPITGPHVEARIAKNLLEAYGCGVPITQVEASA